MKSQDEEKRLINLVKIRPILHDKFNPDYMNSFAKEKQWAEIGALLKKEGKEVKLEWQKLRKQFISFNRRRNKANGSGTEVMITFRHEKSLDFLKNSTKIQELNFTNIGDKEPTTTADQQLLEFTDIPVIVEGESGSPRGQQPDDSLNTDGSTPPHYQSPPKPKMVNFEKELITDYKKGKVTYEDDEFDQVGCLLATQLREVSNFSREKYLDLDHKIHCLIHSTRLDLIYNIS